jgi:outer membrane protein OmpA-like peptidoglycan-associated protein
MATRVAYSAGRLGLAVVMAVVGGVHGQAQTAREAPRVPLVPGLTISAAIAHPSGDAEVLFMVQSVAPDAYRMSFSFDSPDTGGSAPPIMRRVLMKDQREARMMRNWYGAEDPETFPGTTPFFSGAIINDLRQTGKAQLTLLVATSAATLGQTAVQQLPGTLTRIEPGSVAVPMLVNGRMVDLPTIHAKAEAGAGNLRRSADLYVLDDPENPIILRWRDETRNSRLLKIDFPVANSLERDLNERKSAAVYGLYFGFGSAALRPESERVLKEIADTLQRNAGWKLRIEGHTDGIGSDAANLDLSKRRSAAVRDALIGRYKVDGGRLSADGKGESAPKATNDTPDGRAQNRRVELTRQ